MDQHSAPLRAVDGLPSYEEVLSPSRGRRYSGLSGALRAMQPGDVIDATDLTKAVAKQQAIRARAGNVFGPGRHVATRVIDGRVYVARLRPQDALGMRGVA